MLFCEGGENDSDLERNNDDSKNNDDDEDEDTRNGQLKRKCFSMLPSLFRKSVSRTHKMSESSNGPRNHHYNSIETLDDECVSVPSLFPITDSCLIPGSPISPRVKNFNSDMRCLAMSRTDNPYISGKIEQSTNPSMSASNSYLSVDCAPSTPILSIRKDRHCYFCPKKPNIAELNFDHDNNSFNLHEKLIRSPPPNFPEKLDHFLFTENFYEPSTANE